jgi:hypothetical protein
MSFSNEIVQKVWEKGKSVSDHPDTWRKDDCGAWINRGQYGNRDSRYGWEIHHITPEAEGGTDDLSNLRPLQWENNAASQAGPLVCVVTASGSENVRRT